MPVPASPTFTNGPADGGAPPAPRALVEGERTTGDRFRPSLALTPHARRAELLRGVVRLNDDPPTARRVALTVALQAWARQYEVETPGVVRAADVRATLSPWDEPFFAAALYVPADGRCDAAADMAGGPRLIGPPAVAVVVAEGSRDRTFRDRHHALRAGGVTELVYASVGDGIPGSPDRGGIEWFRLDDAPARPGRGDGYLKSAVLPGLWLPEAVLGENPERVDVVAAVRAGCGTLDHALFVNRLCAGRKPR